MLLGIRLPAGDALAELTWVAVDLNEPLSECEVAVTAGMAGAGARAVIDSLVGAQAGSLSRSG